MQNPELMLTSFEHPCFKAIPENRRLRSTENQTVKSWDDRLSLKQWIALEGLHLIQMYSQHYTYPSVLILPGDAHCPKEVIEWLEEHPLQDQVWLVHSKLMKRLTSLKSIPPIMGLVPTPIASQTVLEKTIQAYPSLWLDAIQDPGNAGTLIRTALGAGIRHLVWGKGSVDIWSPKVVRAAQGAHFYMTLWQNIDLPILARSLPHLPKWGAAPGGLSYRNAMWHRNMALVLGNEGQGISQEMQKHLTQTVGIPLNSALESLNVGVAGAILMFEWQHHNS